MPIVLPDREEFRVFPGMLYRAVRSRSGSRYAHSCPRRVYEEVLHRIDAGSLTIEAIAASGSGDPLPWSAVASAFAFLRERGVIVRVGKRCVAASADCYLDGMIEWSAAERVPDLEEATVGALLDLVA